MSSGRKHPGTTTDDKGETEGLLKSIRDVIARFLRLKVPLLFTGCFRRRSLVIDFSRL